MPEIILITGAMRCGTTVIARTLGETPKALCLGEIFHPSSRKLADFVQQKPVSLINDHIRCVSQFLLAEAQKAEAEYLIVDCKLNYWPLLPGQSFVGVHIPDIFFQLGMRRRVIVMRRLNGFQRLVSEARAHTTGRWEAAPDAGVDATKMKLDADTVVQRIFATIRHFGESMLALSTFAKPMIIDYESMIAGDFWRGEFARLAQQLFPCTALPEYAPTMSRQSPGRGIDYVENEDAVSAALAKAGIGWMNEPLEVCSMREHYLALEKQLVGYAIRDREKAMAAAFESYYGNC